MSVAWPGGGSYHNHPGYCDGSGTVADYAEAALAAGLTSLGVSCHAPVPFTTSWTMPAAAVPAYVAEVRATRVAYQGRLDLRLGMEVDYLHPDVAPAGDAFQAEVAFAQPLDYVVASVHFVGHDPDGAPWAIDHTAESFADQLTHIYQGDVRRLLEDYFVRVVAMARAAAGWGRPVIVGHVDKVKMWNVGGRYFAEDAPWYLAAADEALAAIRAAGLVVEINTAGLPRAHGESYPGPRLLRRCHELGIPATISSDAHRPADLTRRFDEAAALLIAAGYRTMALLGADGWEERPLG
jgi:histidinol-phosphatase (PHP family)